jgi:hypothetical protein
VLSGQCTSVVQLVLLLHGQWLLLHLLSAVCQVVVGGVALLLELCVEFVVASCVPVLLVRIILTFTHLVSVVVDVLCCGVVLLLLCLCFGLDLASNVLEVFVAGYRL